MKAAWISDGKGIASLKVEAIDVPQLGPGEAQVRLHCATLNFRDLIVAKGLLIAMDLTGGAERRIPMSCATGVVTAVGDGVSRAWKLRYRRARKEAERHANHSGRRR